MKKIYTIAAFVLMATFVHAQYIYTDFDENQNEVFYGWPNAPEVIANPDASGANTSDNVGEWVRTAEQWAHVYMELDGKIDFSSHDHFQLKVWSPVACNILFKLEDKTNGGVFYEVSQSVADAEEWVELSFDFSQAGSFLYDKIVIFFDFQATVDNTFYFDDVVGPEYGEGEPGSPVTLPVTFDDDEINYNLADFGGAVSEIIVDPTDETNKVVQTIKTDGAETWAGTTVAGGTGFPEPIPFSEEATTMSVRVWSPTANTPVRLKVEASNDANISVETETLTTIANDWETIIFDFANEAEGTAEINFGYNYNMASIFFNFGTAGADAGEQTYFWDDMEFAGEGNGDEKPLVALDVQENFEDDGFSTIPEWKFQDPDMFDLNVVVDPVNTENHVADYVRSGNFEWTNAQFILNHRMDLSERNVFEMKVFFPSTNDYSGNLTPTAALKLQNSLLGGEAWSTQTEVKHTVDTFDEWVTLEFDFSAASDRTDYDQMVVQLGGEGHSLAGQFYFDDLILLDAETSVFEESFKTFNLYPNPVTDHFRIKGVEDITSLRIYNIQGQLVVSQKGSFSVIDVSGLLTGLYQVIIETSNGETLTSKMLKQ